MLLYRAFPYLESAQPGQSGHPMFLYRPQGQGRLDNPTLYDTWYFGLTPEVAVGETFADVTTFADGMFQFPALPGSRRALGTYEIPDNSPILDLDDANHLQERALRPTQVIARNRPATQAWARRIFDERADSGDRRWRGVRWWSYHRPHWVVIALFTPRDSAPIHTLVEVETLSLGHASVVSAANTLGKTTNPGG